MKKKIAIIGAGISGLTAAWYLAEKGHDITVFEKSDKVGGLIDSTLEKGFFFEKGPRSFSTQRSSELLKLIDDLKLTDDIIYSSDNAKARYLLVKQNLCKIPSSLFSFLTSKLTRKHLITFLKEPFKLNKIIIDETIFEFAKRRFDESVALQFFDPITTGIYGGDIKELSICTCFPDLVKLEKKYGSIIKGLLLQKKSKNLKALFTLKKGLMQIPIKISNHKNIRVLLNNKIEKLSESCNQVKIYLNKTVFKFDYAIVATPYYVLKNLLNVPFKFDSIKYNSLTTINIGFNQKKTLPNGFGYLVPRIENEKVLGCIFDSNIFPSQNRSDQTRLTLIIDNINKNHSLHFFVRDILRRHLKLNCCPDYFFQTSFNQAIAQFQLNHQFKILKLNNNFKKHFSKIFFTGSYLENVSINGCIKKAKQTVNKVENKINL